MHVEQVADVALLEADITDEPSLSSMAAAAEVVVCTTGPYSIYGRPVIKVCASPFTEYRSHLLATRAGAQSSLVCACVLLP